MKKKLLIIISTLLVVALVGLGFVGNYFYNLAINANTSKSFLNDSEHLGPGDTSGNTIFNKERREAALKWSETAYTRRSLQSYDNLALNGYYFENENSNHRYAIVVHGYMSKALDMIVPIKRIFDEGYTILAPDCRGCGDSEGDYVGMGWHDRLDMVDWINTIVAQDPQAEIILYGVSMGGATVMMTAGEELPANVKAIVEDCGYTSADGIFTYQLKDLFGLPKFPVIQAASVVSKIRAGYWLGEASALDQVAKSVTPMFFIHGDADAFVPFDMVHEVYEAATCPKELYVVPDAAHGYSATLAGEVYWGKVFDFVNQFVTPDAA